MRDSITLAQASEFVDKLPEGIEAPIAQGGANVSGGQKQRLSIARALARKPEILIFDDSFSALDYKTDAMLRKGLSEHLQRTTARPSSKTTILSAFRMVPIRCATIMQVVLCKCSESPFRSIRCV